MPPTRREGALRREADNLPRLSKDTGRCYLLVALMVFRCNRFRENHVIAPEIGGLRVLDRLPSRDYLVPAQIATCFLEYLRQHIGRPIADQIVDVRAADGQIAVFLDESSPVIDDCRWLVLCGEIRGVEVAPDVFGVVRA